MIVQDLKAFSLKKNYSQNETDLSDIQFYLDFFEKNGPVSLFTESEEYKKLQHDSVYPAFTYDLVQINSYPNGHFFQPGKLTPEVEKTNMLNHFMSKQAVSHLEALEFLQNSDMQFVQNWNGNL